MKILYIWERDIFRRFHPRRIEIGEDTDKKMSLPEASGILARLKAATDRAQKYKDNFLNKLKRK